MPTRLRAGKERTLEESLPLPRIDETPYLESHEGRIEVKVLPQRRHSVIEKRLTQALDDFAEPSGIGAAFPEWRCTFAEYWPGHALRNLSGGDVRDGSPVLPGFHLPVVEVFHWLTDRVHHPDQPGDGPR